MSIVYQMTSVSTSKATGAAQTSAGTQSKGGVTGADGGFLQTLAQSLNSTTSEENNSATVGGLTVNPLAIALATSEEGEETSLTAVLDSLFGDLDSIDEVLENDPTLLADLQNLIQQLYAQLNDASVETEKADGTVNAPTTVNATAVMDLTEHPAAVRFVLQDVLTQLVASMTEPDSPIAKNTAEFKQLLQTLQNQLQEAGVDLSSNKGWTELKTIVDSMDSLKDQGVQTKANPSTEKELTVISSSTKELKVTGETDVNTSSTASVGGEMDHSKVITAGELSMRTSGTAVAKPAEPVMQASQFAKEMTQFVVNKLDIVQQKGFSEATISLRPEHLGKLDVQITLQNGQLVARFMTEHAMAKDMLEQQMTQLRTSLQSQGIQVERIEVTQSSSLGSEMYHDDGRQQGNNSQDQRRSREREEQTDDAITTANLQEELRNWRSENEEGNDFQGGSFTAKA
ncbi:flagellar hook-length control protein FliK [Paenibacillus illinoisensis]|uniref:flagellar hook-length control protein FliK n=1 Tax=Paenibacillus illinoisensis TaxID=59845 RepID=UPI0030179AD0